MGRTVYDTATVNSQKSGLFIVNKELHAPFMGDTGKRKYLNYNLAHLCERITVIMSGI